MQFLPQMLVMLIAKVHSYLMTLNDAHEQHLSDKQLHFIIIGVIGLILVFAIYPFFKALSENHVMVIVVIYVFTLIVGLTFAIAIGQQLNGERTMAFEDLVYGAVGFVMIFVVFTIIKKIAHIIVLGITKLFGFHTKLR